MKQSSVSQVPIFTIGYGNRTMDEFISLLKIHQISYLIDIRTSPYSKYNPSFSKDNLESALGENHIRYVYMGNALGGRPDVPSCYTDGKVDYQKLREKDFYKGGINRLEKAWSKHLLVMLLCSEAKPEECHRSKLVGETLIQIGIEVVHIDENGSPKTHKEVINSLTNGQLSFLSSQAILSKSRKKYQKSESEND